MNHRYTRIITPAVPEKMERKFIPSRYDRVVTPAVPAVTETVTAQFIVQKTLDAIRLHGPEKFDMGTWAKTAVDGVSHDLNTVAKTNHFDINNCGSTACMAGHMAVVCKNHEIDVAAGRYLNAGVFSNMLGVSDDSDRHDPFSHSPQRWPENMYDAYKTAIRVCSETGAEWLAAIRYLEDWLEENPEDPHADIGERDQEAIDAKDSWRAAPELWWALGTHRPVRHGTWTFSRRPWTEVLAELPRRRRDGFYNPHLDMWVTNAEDIPST